MIKINLKELVDSIIDLRQMNADFVKFDSDKGLYIVSKLKISNHLTNIIELFIGTPYTDAFKCENKIETLPKALLENPLAQEHEGNYYLTQNFLALLFNLAYNLYAKHCDEIITKHLLPFNQIADNHSINITYSLLLNSIIPNLSLYEKSILVPFYKLPYFCQQGVESFTIDLEAIKHSVHLSKNTIIWNFIELKD